MNNSISFDSLEALIYASMKYVGSKELEDYNSVSNDIAFSEKSKQRLIKRLMKEKEYIENHKIYRPVKEFFKRLAIAILVAVTLLFTACMCIEPIREATWEIVTKWYDNYISIETFEVIEPIPTNNIAINLDSPLPTTILEHKEPALPEGFEQYVMLDLPQQYYVEYENQNVVLEYRQTLLENYKLLISNNNTIMTDIEINGNSGKSTTFVTGSVVVNTVFWHDGKYCYYISGNESQELIIKLAQTIQ